MARRRKAQLELSVAAEADIETQAQAEVPATVPEARPPTRWRVTRTASVTLFGQCTTLREGKIVTITGYGADGIARIATQVELEPVD